MLGLLENSWMLDLIGNKQFSGIGEASGKELSSTSYCAYFGLGHCFRLQDRPLVFKLSLAGMSLGSLLLREVSPAELRGRVWDLGTGSGVLAFLLRGMGAGRVTASDFYAEAVELARSNELLNFDEPEIDFQVRDLFGKVPALHRREDDKYELVVFNPPGWRTPSAKLLTELSRHAPEGGLPAGAMFHGDSLLRRFLNELPSVLKPGGRAIVGMNSLVGIQDVIHGHRQDCCGHSPLSFRLIERHSLPLLFYSPTWKKTEKLLREEFTRWRDCHGSAFTQDAQGRLYWSYEIVECRLAPSIA